MLPTRNGNSKMSAVLERSTTISPDLPPAVSSGAESDAPVTGRRPLEAWHHINAKLLTWAANPDYFADEEFGSPSGEIIQNAIRIATVLCHEGFSAPDRVVPDADGGIVFETRRGGISESIHLWDDGTVEYYRLSGTSVVSRVPLS